MRRRTLSASFAALAVMACVNDRSLAPANEPDAVSAGPARVTSADLAATSGFVLIGNGHKLPADLDRRVGELGAQVTGSLPRLGLAFVTSTDPEFATKAGRIAGILGVAPDVQVRWTPPAGNAQVVDLTDFETPEVAPSAFGGGETFRPIQWAPDAIHAVEAWDAGHRGAGARVAILDGGIHSTHIDIAPRLDVARSTSFVPNQPFNFDQAFNDPVDPNEAPRCILNDTFWHGTHVAGIVAAPGQNIGTVGIAPDATIIGVKVLHCGTGAFSWVIQGIVHAATPIAEGGAGADVINLSLGALFPRQGVGAAQLAVAIGRATTYAYQRGVLVVAAAGNDANDMDHTANYVHLPSDAPHVMSVAATGPMGWAQGATNLDRPASYTNFGQSAVTVAGPGGDFALPGNAVCSKPRLPSGSVVQFCWVMDMVMAPCRGGTTSISSYCWAAGTSMASPAVAGVAALIIGKYGKLSPTDLRSRIEKSADDIGKAGNDDFYGAGRVNAARAVQ